MRRVSFPIAAISIPLVLICCGCGEDDGVSPPAQRPDSVEISFQDGLMPYPFYRGTRDAVVRDGPGMQNRNAGQAPSDTLGYAELAGALYARRLLVRFDVSGITDCSSVLDASLEISVEPGHPGNPVYDIFEATVPEVMTGSWAEGTGYPDDGVSWLYADGVVPWSTPGGDFVAIPLDQAPAGGDSVLTFSLPPGLVLRWFRHPETNHGLLVAARPAAGQSYRIVHLREYAVPAKRPRLWVKYWRGG